MLSESYEIVENYDGPVLKLYAQIVIVQNKCLAIDVKVHADNVTYGEQDFLCLACFWSTQVNDRSEIINDHCVEICIFWRVCLYFRLGLHS